MMSTLRRRRAGPRAFGVACFTGCLLSAQVVARVGEGEHYHGSSEPGADGGDGNLPTELLALALRLTFEHPRLVLPLLVVGALLYWVYFRRQGPTARTQRAFEAREAEHRTHVGPEHVRGWVNALQRKDPTFELQALLDKVQSLFIRTQEAWFRRNLTSVRPFLSDATFQRLQVQLELMRRQGVRDALCDVQVLEVQLIGLEQSEWFDSAHVRIHARMRDTEAPATVTDDQALALARRVPQESFTEVWTFVRKPGVQTRIGEDLYQGKCPQCGAPFRGGASSSCEFCKAVVNSGNYDWTLSEITQGLEHVRLFATIDGLLDARKTDRALNVEMLEDRASLIFWRWIDAQSQADARRVAKVASAGFVQRLATQLSDLERQGRRKVLLECAVGSVTTRLLRAGDAVDEAHVEVRWSARMATGPVHEPPPPLPMVPQRWVFTLVRQAGAQTYAATGMSTFRCSKCHAPLTDSASSDCDYCGVELSHGARDWVLEDANPFERWEAIEQSRFDAVEIRRRLGREGPEAIPDVQERERLLYLMAAVAAADGAVHPKERRLLQLCAERWGVPWPKVELALAAGPQLFERLVPKGSTEAEIILRTLVEVALVDGRIDRRERQLLVSTAGHLGLSEALRALLVEENLA